MTAQRFMHGYLSLLNGAACMGVPVAVAAMALKGHVEIAVVSGILGLIWLPICGYASFVNYQSFNEFKLSK